MGLKHRGKNPCLYFGTFNPIHTGHLVLAQSALNQYADHLGFETVLFMPSGIPPHRQADRDLAPAIHRFKMVELAIAENPQFTCSDMEINKSTPAYTVDTLEALLSTGQITAPCPFILGTDAIAQLSQWHRPDRFLELVTLLPAPRPGYPVVNTLQLSEKDVSIPSYPLQGPETGFSSTWIRQRIAQQESFQSLRYSLPEAVRHYIRNNTLYCS